VDPHHYAGVVSDAPLLGQVVLVTGGGSGIGLACARVLHADGATVVLTGRRREVLNVAVETLGERALAVVGDVTDEDHMRAAVEVAESCGRFTMAVANAGFGSAAPLFQTTLDQWQSVLSTNLTGAFLTIKHAGAAIVASGGGSIVAISSIAGVSTHRFMTPYCVSKAGLEMLVRNAADELGGAGLRVNAIRPGLVPTDATVGLMSMPSIVDDYVAQMPLGRAGNDTEVAALARFLLGPESAWITGTCVSVDGGHHLRRGPDISPAIAFGFGTDAAAGKVRP
jgi:NAD(P)-dependent dehydrogenase (short-subunit alcohol dehydrogenase family)